MPVPKPPRITARRGGSPFPLVHTPFRVQNLLKRPNNSDLWHHLGCSGWFRIFRNDQPRSVDTSKTTNNSDLCNPMTCVAEVRCCLKHLDVRVGNVLYQLRKWLSTKNRSPRRSTPRHPIATASTAKPPDPMPCALAAILLPE
jgi:hypothetical protein